MDFTNYFNKTRGRWKGCKTPKRKPDYKSYSGSLYWYDYKKQIVYRFSSHWSNGNKKYGVGFVASCLWYLITNVDENTLYKKGGCGKIKLYDLKLI